MSGVHSIQLTADQLIPYGNQQWINVFSGRTLHGTNLQPNGLSLNSNMDMNSNAENVLNKQLLSLGVKGISSLWLLNSACDYPFP
jgi:hypothetical protein